MSYAVSPHLTWLIVKNNNAFLKKKRNIKKHFSTVSLSLCCIWRVFFLIWVFGMNTDFYFLSCRHNRSSSAFCTCCQYLRADYWKRATKLNRLYAVLIGLAGSNFWTSRTGHYKTNCPCERVRQSSSVAVVRYVITKFLNVLQPIKTQHSQANDVSLTFLLIHLLLT